MSITYRTQGISETLIRTQTRDWELRVHREGSLDFEVVHLSRTKAMHLFNAVIRHRR